MLADWNPRVAPWTSVRWIFIMFLAGALFFISMEIMRSNLYSLGLSNLSSDGRNTLHWIFEQTTGNKNYASYSVQTGQIYSVGVSFFLGRNKPLRAGDVCGDININFSRDPNIASKLVDFALEEISSHEPSDGDVSTILEIEQRAHENGLQVDSMLCRRENPREHEAMHKMKNEFMANWDGLRTKDKEYVFVLAATNRPIDLDEVVTRRLP